MYQPITPSALTPERGIVLHRIPLPEQAADDVYTIPAREYNNLLIILTILIILTLSQQVGLPLENVQPAKSVGDRHTLSTRNVLPVFVWRGRLFSREPEPTFSRFSLPLPDRDAATRL